MSTYRLEVAVSDKIAMNALSGRDASLLVCMHGTETGTRDK